MGSFFGIKFIWVHQYPLDVLQLSANVKAKFRDGFKYKICLSR